MTWVLADIQVDQMALADKLARAYPPPKRGVNIGVERLVGHRRRLDDLVRRYERATGRAATSPAMTCPMLPSLAARPFGRGVASWTRRLRFTQAGAPAGTARTVVEVVFALYLTECHVPGTLTRVPYWRGVSMPARSRSNPLALAVLVCLAERTMHPYEVAQTLRIRHKDDSVRLNYGSLYAVITVLVRRGLIEAAETERAGRLPERTIYRITDAGSVEMHDWLAELLAVPTKEYPALEAALSFLPALAPAEAVSLLEERSGRLEAELAGGTALRELVEKARLPRLFWVEAEFAMALRQAELDFVRRLLADISSGDLDGLAWWRQVHDNRDQPVPLPPPWGPEPDSDVTDDDTRELP